MLRLLAISLSALCISLSASPASLNLREQVVGFSQAQAKKRWKLEDTMIQREQLFQDGLREEYREVVTKGLQQILDASDWKTAKRAYREQLRAETALLRQKVRVHRDEFDLTLLATTNELDQELSDFLAPLEKQFRESKDEAYRKAQEDFNTSRDELRDSLRDWKERARGLKTPSDFSAE